MRSAIGENRPDARRLDEDRDLKILGVRRVGNVGCIILMPVRGCVRAAQNPPPGILRSCPIRFLIPKVPNIGSALLRDSPEIVRVFAMGCFKNCGILENIWGKLLAVS
jgi:hypothetical protein